MSKSSQSRLVSGLAAVALVVPVATAQAGGFALKEQSAAATGMANAGVAAGGGGLGSIFWNPAVLSKYAGFQSYSTISGILPSSKNFGTAATYSAFGLNSGEIGQDTLLPASAYAYQINDRLWVGLSVSTPFGLQTRNPVVSATSPFAIHSKLVTYNINPMLAWKVNDWLTLGVGLQLQYGKALLTLGIPSPLTPTANVATLKGTGWSGGLTAGALITPWAGTEIGVGYRSAIRHDLDGSFRIPGALNLPAHFTADVADVFTLGLRQRLTSNFDVLAGFEYNRWDLGVLPVYNTLTNTQIFLSPTTPVSVPFRYKNGWMLSLGGEYRLLPSLTLRAGTAYERSPIDDTNRRPSLPDSDRIWASAGFSYQLTAKDRIDFGYSHVFVKDANINVTNDAGTIFYRGRSKSSVDIVSASWNHRFDTPAAPALVAKY